jgi:protein-S-isoprenylcysteine O-methyltransferase Ste14
MKVAKEPRNIKLAFAILLAIVLVGAIHFFFPAGFLDSIWARLAIAILAILFVVFYRFRFASKPDDKLQPRQQGRTGTTLLWSGISCLICSLLWAIISALTFSAPLYLGGFNKDVQADIIVVPFSILLTLGICMIGFRIFLPLIRML